MRTLAEQVGTLEDVFRAVGRTRMHGVPVLNPRLAVQAVGFALAGDDERHALGVLVTPWFMNLLRLPLHPAAATLPVGERGARDIGTQRFDFIGAHEHGLGGFEACSLFSPMFEFASQDAAVATAIEVLKELRAAPAAPARRGFLFGRRGVPA